MAGESPLARRLGIAALCVLALAASIGLAWWQWSRFESASGTFQNLGYVLQWPLFGLFPAFMVWRWRRLRQREQDQSAAAETGTAEQTAPTPARPPKPVTRTSPAAAHDEPDDELAAYNRFLAQLHAQDQARDQQETR